MYTIRDTYCTCTTIHRIFNSLVLMRLASEVGPSVPDFTLSVCTAVRANFSVSISSGLIKKTTVLYTVFLMGQFHETYIIRRAKLRTAKF